jgi:hypothetical protein
MLTFLFFPIFKPEFYCSFDAPQLRISLLRIFLYIILTANIIAIILLLSRGRQKELEQMTGLKAEVDLLVANARYTGPTQLSKNLT